jgi:hypothetical protein
LTSIEEIITNIQGIVDKLDEAATAGHGAMSETDDAVTQANALSATGLAGALQVVKDTLEAGVSQVTGSIDTFKEAIMQAQGG